MNNDDEKNQQRRVFPLSIISRKLFVRNSLLNHNLFFYFSSIHYCPVDDYCCGMGIFFTLTLMLMLSLPDHDATLVSLWIS